MPVTFSDTAGGLAANGYAPIPIAPHSKRPAIEAWQKYEYKPGDDRKFGDRVGSGLLCGYLRGIDVDVMRPELAAEIRAQAEAIWGRMPARIGQAPKVLLLVRSVAVGHKLFSLRYRFPDDAAGAKPHGIEILGAGQQFIAYGYHPDTRAPYTWNGAGEPLEVPFDQLPIATEAELFGFLQWVNNRLLDAGGTPTGNLAHNDSATRTTNDELEAHNPDECRAAIAHLDNSDLHWDDWIYVGLAIKGALGDAGLSAWHEFSRKSSKYDPAVADRAYQSFKPERIGAGTLYRLALDSGWERPTYGVDLSGLLPDKPPAPLLLDVAQLRATVGSLRWLVKHAIPANSVGIVYGPSGSFKSFIVLDMALHIAHGLPWLGRKSGQGSVVYVAAEGGTGLLARLDAWHQKHGLDPAAAPFRTCVVPLMLDHPRDLKQLSDAIAAADIGNPSLIVLDTLSQTMAGDENEARDTANYLRGVGSALRARFGATVMPVHHTGHSAGDRPRGSSAIKGNTDFLFAVSREEGQMTALLECKKQKDGDNGPALPFVLERLEVGRDDDGDPMTSLVANYHDNASAILAASKLPKAATKYERTLLDLITVDGRIYGEVRDEFYAKLGNMGSDAKKHAFSRAYKGLVERWSIVENGAIVQKVVTNE